MISKETRYRAVVHYTHFLRSLRKVSAIYKVSKSSLQRWTSQDLNVVHAKRRRRSIFQKVESIMKDTIRSNPFITLHDLSHHISHECNITSSRQTMGRCRQNCEFVRKKVTRVVDVSADTTHATRVDDFCDRHVQKSISGNIVYRQKIRAIFQVAQRERVTHLVLGALGCGSSWRPSPDRHVAEIFRETCSRHPRLVDSSFELIVFAILPRPPLVIPLALPLSSLLLPGELISSPFASQVNDKKSCSIAQTFRDVLLCPPAQTLHQI